MNYARFLLLTLFLLILTPWVGRAGGNDKGPILEVRFTESGPVMDGDPTDTVWDQARSVKSFYHMGEFDGTSPPTTVKALYDNTSLYLLYVCEGQSSEGVRASSIRRDGPMWETDDAVEFFFFPGKQDTNYVELATNALGAKYDIESSTVDYYKDFTWTARPGWYDDRWVVELSVPLRQFVDHVDEGEVWRANFARHFWHGDGDATVFTWGRVEKTLHEPDNFGRLRFEREAVFDSTQLETDWIKDESRTIANLRNFRPDKTYEPLTAYFDVIATMIQPKRSFETFSRNVIDYAREFPDSASSLEFVLQTIYPAAFGYRVASAVVDTFMKQVEGVLDLDETDRGLMSLSRGIYYNKSGQKEKWIEIYREISGGNPALAATAASIMLSNTSLAPDASEEDAAVLHDALAVFTDLVIRKSTPIYLKKGVGWLTAKASSQELQEKIFYALKKTALLWPDEIMTLTHSLMEMEDISNELSLTLKKVELELYADQRSPFFSRDKADSLLVLVAPLDQKYARRHLYPSLKEKLHLLDTEYSAMGSDSLPTEFKKAMALRKYLDAFNAIDMVFAFGYDAIDSLDKAVAYMEQYKERAGKRWRTKGPVPRYLEELKFRRDHHHDPQFYHIPRDRFRLVYRIQPFRGIPDFLDISSDGTVILYPNIPDSLDPRGTIGTEVSTEIDSPAVKFRLTREEMDSLHLALDHYDYLKFKVKYTEECRQCGNTEMTLFTPWNMRTVHLEGKDLSKPPFLLKQYVSSMLEKYLRPLYYIRGDWARLNDYYKLWAEYNKPGRSADDRLDALLDLFALEPMPSSWQNPDWYLDPLMNLGEETGRRVEVDAAVGLRYFESTFKWRSFAKERIPREKTEDMDKARSYLLKAAEGNRDKKNKEWYSFLAGFTQDYSYGIAALEQEVDSLKNGENRADALSILIWLECARGELDDADRLYFELLQSKAGKELRFEATLRMMLSDKDQRRPVESLKHLKVIENSYSRFLSARRRKPILKLAEYSDIDLSLDHVALLLQTGDLEGAGAMIRSIDASYVPIDRKIEYDEISHLMAFKNIPESYNARQLRDYVRVLSALHRFGIHDLSGQWAIWLLDNLDDQRLRAQIFSSLLITFKERETWDDLQAEIAGTLLSEYQADSQWRGVDPSDQLLEKVITYGDEEDVRRFWREELLPQSRVSSRLAAFDRLASYFRDHGDYNETRAILEKIVKELPPDTVPTSTTELILAKYTLDLATLYSVNLDLQDRGIAIVDSLADNLSGLQNGTKPYVFVAISDWKAERLGWDALVKFVQPHGDSLVQAEKTLQGGIYHPGLLPDMPLPSPLLALACITQKGGPKGRRNDLFELLGIESGEADAVLNGLRRSPHRINLDCERAQLLNWEDKSFETIVESYSRQIR